MQYIQLEWGNREVLSEMDEAHMLDLWPSGILVYCKANGRRNFGCPRKRYKTRYVKL